MAENGNVACTLMDFRHGNENIILEGWTMEIVIVNIVVKDI